MRVFTNSTYRIHINVKLKRNKTYQDRATYKVAENKLYKNFTDELNTKYE